MKITKPAVSILVPVYNVAKYLRQCLDSLVNQTLEDIEIICVNDGSTDDSLAILNEYASVDSRIMVVDKPNGGLPSARNAGLNAANGKFVGFVDGDDFVDVNMYKKMYTAAMSNGADIVVCGGHPFPKEENAPVWLKESLSPQDIVYKNGGEAALYMERGAKPFLWRDLIKKDLIDRNNFRLDENIVVGEDQAFQFKVFPAAQKVAFISDKLYYYRYSRPESIMNEPMYKDYGARVMKHVEMIASIAANMKFSAKESAIRFFEWSISFIYWDIIRVSGTERLHIAKRFCKLLSDIGYFNYVKDYTWETRGYFDYLYNMRGTTHNINPIISMVLVIGSCGEYLRTCLDSLLAQYDADFEILVYDNNTDDTTKKIVFEYLRNDPRICVRMGEWAPVCQKYNDAITTAKGRYIAFISAYDYIKRSDWLNSVVNIMEQDESISLIGYKEGVYGKSDIGFCQTADYHQFVYRVDKIRQYNLRFEDYALLTGSVFFTKYCLVSEQAYFLPKFIMKGQSLRRQSIYADEAKLIMRAFVWLLQKSKECGLNSLALRLTDLLNSENYVRLITDATYGFYLDKSSLVNPKEDYHTEIFSLLVKANELAVLHDNDKALLRTLAVFIDKRHRFLDAI